MTVLFYSYIYLFISINLLPITVNAEYQHKRGMLRNMSNKWLKDLDTKQRNYGISVTDVDNDNEYEMFIAGYDGPNIVLKFDQGGSISQNNLINIAQTGTPFEALADPQGQAIGVAACDIDGDSREEIYVLNTNNAFAGQSSYGDKLFKWRNGRYVDLYSDPVNEFIEAKNYAGRSVACIDRLGTGKYGFIIATYALSGEGSFSLIEMDERHPDNNVPAGLIVLKNVAHVAKINKSTGGRAVAVGPIVSDNGRSDIFFGNEGNSDIGNEGANNLFRNLGNGSFYDVARDTGITDAQNAVRGVALHDFNRDGLLDIVYGNWNSEHKLFLQQNKGHRRIFTDVATSTFRKTSPVRTVLVADFDNNGYSEIFFNNIVINDGFKSSKQTMSGNYSNRLFTVYSDNQNVTILEAEIGDAGELDGYGTGAAVADLNKDGFLDLVTSHGEGKRQTLEVYSPLEGYLNNWIRVAPETEFWAPARGATVKLQMDNGTQQMQVIDGGSGYLCQMEPVAHFGLGDQIPVKLTVTWPDGSTYSMDVNEHDMKGTLHIQHEKADVKLPKFGEHDTEMIQEFAKPDKQNKTVNVTLNVTKTKHEEL